MDIQAQFNMVAEEYDANRRRFIPCFEEYYVETTAFAASCVNDPKCIVDLGAGTGLLASYWYKHFPQARYILVDIAEDMLNVARRRFAGLDNVDYLVSDYINSLPETPFDTVVSALSIHHLEDTDKQKLFDKLYGALPEGGVFVNYDQFCAGDPVLNERYDSCWEAELYGSGLTPHDIELWQERRKFDRECSAEQETDMLKRSGFRRVKCIYSCQKFSVIMAVR